MQCGRINIPRNEVDTLAELSKRLTDKGVLFDVRLENDWVVTTSQDLAHDLFVRGDVTQPYGGQGGAKTNDASLPPNAIRTNGKPEDVTQPYGGQRIQSAGSQDNHGAWPNCD